MSAIWVSYFNYIITHLTPMSRIFAYSCVCLIVTTFTYLYDNYCKFCSGKNLKVVMDLTKTMNKLNKIMDTNQKLQTVLDIINTCLCNLHESMMTTQWK